MGWNADIQPQQSVYFGIIMDGQFTEYPNTFSFIVGEYLTTDGILTTLSIQESWGEGFNSVLEITNNGESNIKDWQVEFDYDNEIISLWNGQIISHEGNHYIIKHHENSHVLKIAETVSFGFQVHGGDIEASISNVIISSFVHENESNTNPDESVQPEDDWITNTSAIKEVTPDDVAYNEETCESYAKIKYSLV